MIQFAVNSRYFFAKSCSIVSAVGLLEADPSWNSAATVSRCVSIMVNRALTSRLAITRPARYVARYGC